MLAKLVSTWKQNRKILNEIIDSVQQVMYKHKGGRSFDHVSCKVPELPESLNGEDIEHHLWPYNTQMH